MTLENSKKNDIIDNRDINAIKDKIQGIERIKRKENITTTGSLSNSYGKDGDQKFVNKNGQMRVYYKINGKWYYANLTEEV